MGRDPVKLKALVEQLEKIDAKTKFRQIDFYRPYEKQAEFHDLGLTLRERLLMAGNRNGKTYCGAFETACHLTGEYPDWWLGRRWERPVKAWAASDTGLTVRDVVQGKLCGEPGVMALQGTGMIPKAAVDWKNGVTLARGVADLYDTVPVKHISGDWSVLRFKTYEQGRKKWQGESLDFIWYDEEPDEDIYSEGLARIGDRAGMVFVTFTPLKGLSNVVTRYLDEPSADRGTVTMSIDDALHITPENRAKIVEGYLPHEREARANGTPMLGSGRIFMATEESISCDMTTPLPPHWFYLWGTDFGIGHAFGAALLAWDKDTDIIYVVHSVKMKDALPINHAAAMKPIAPGCPVAWPQDGTAREKSGETVSALYKNEGLKMLHEHATHPDGGLGTEAGVLDMDQRMRTGRLKVARHLTDWFAEYRKYHRKDGMIVKVDDDLLSATRIGLMMKRFAKQLAVFDVSGRYRNQGAQIAADVDFELN